MAIMAISVTPIGTASTGVGDFVADAVRVIERSGLRYELNAMHTVVEAAPLFRSPLRLSLPQQRDAPSG